MHKPGQNVFVVPNLNVKEITQYFGDMGINIKPSEILNPTASSTQRIYDLILELYQGDKSQVDVSRKLSGLDNPAHYEEAVAQVLLQKRMSNFMRKIGIDNFCTRDLQPESRRLVTLLSVIINFSMYRDNKRQVYENMCQMSEDKEALKKEIKTKIMNIERRIGNQEVENKRIQEEENVLQQEIATYESELKGLYKHHRNLLQDTETLKAEKGVLSDRASEFKLLIMNAKQQITCLKSQVVSDPTKLLELLEEMRILIKKEKESLSTLETKKHDMLEKLVEYEEMKNIFQKIITSALSSKDCDRQLESIKKECLSIDIETKSIISSTRALEIRMNHISRQISHIESKIFYLQDTDKKNSDDIYGKLESLKVNYNKMTDEQKLNQEKVSENTRETKTLEYEILKNKNKHENDVTDIMSMLCVLKDDVFNYFVHSKEMFDSVNS